MRRQQEQRVPAGTPARGMFCCVGCGHDSTLRMYLKKKKKRHERKLVFLPLPPGYCPSLGRGEGNKWYFKVCPFSVKQA